MKAVDVALRVSRRVVESSKLYKTLVRSTGQLRYFYPLLVRMTPALPTTNNPPSIEWYCHKNLRTSS